MKTGPFVTIMEFTEQEYREHASEAITNLMNARDDLGERLNSLQPKTCVYRILTPDELVRRTIVLMSLFNEYPPGHIDADRISACFNVSIEAAAKAYDAAVSLLTAKEPVANVGDVEQGG